MAASRHVPHKTEQVSTGSYAFHVEFEAAYADGMKWASRLVMIRASIPLVLLVLILGIPAITSGTAYVGQVLFVMLLVLFMGTLVDAFTNRVQDDR